jgi:hypothetical protein
MVAVMAAVALAAPVQASVGIAVSPALIELDGAAGDSGSVDITVSNRGDEAFDAVTAIEPFETMTGDRSAVDWSEVNPHVLRLDPGTSGTLRYKVTIPPDVGSGGRYAQLAIQARVVQAGASASPDAGASTIGGVMLIPLFLTVHGHGVLTREPALDRTGLFLEADGSLGLRAEVHNSGDVHVPLVGSAQVTSTELTSPASIDISLGRVLPGRSRTYAGATTFPGVPDATYDLTLGMGVPSPDDQTVFEPTLEGRVSVVATPELSVADLRVCEALEAPPQVAMTLRNEGSLGIVPTAGFQILDETGSVLLNLSAAGQALSWPGTDHAYEASLSESLAAGSYTLVGAVVYGGGASIEAQLPFTIGATPAAAASPCEVEPVPSP